jgi:arylsulfatase A-like enzyme
MAPNLPVNYLPEHPFPHGNPDIRDENLVPGVFKRRDEATIRNEKGKEFACIENIDVQVGRVLKKLEETGELDNTYIFFTADHGIAVGKHGLVGKQNLYEHSWRVPFIVAGPEIKKGSKVRGNIYLLDVLPTLCDLAGIEIPSVVDGKSFSPVLQGQTEIVREVLYGAYCGGTKPGIRCVKKGDWKLIKYDVMDGKVRETQLFNLRENPNELITEHHDPKVVGLTGNKPKKKQVDLAENPKYASKRKEMETLLLQEMRKVNDPYRFWDQEE